MTRPRRNRITRGTAEQLLRGAPGRPTAEQPALVDLLAAAAAAPTPAELAGEHAAVMAFRDARHRPAPIPRRVQMIHTVLAKLATVKLMAVTATVTGLGGVALAASTGSLPAPVQDAAHGVFGAPAANAVFGAPAAHGGVPKPSHQPSVEPSGTPSATPSRQAPPSPSLLGLCQAYRAHPMRERGKAAESSAFTVLINEAGGADKVSAYCQALASASPAAPHGRVERDTADRQRPAKQSRPSAYPENSHRPSHAPEKPIDRPDHP